MIINTIDQNNTSCMFISFNLPEQDQQVVPLLQGTGKLLRGVSLAGYNLVVFYYLIAFEILPDMNDGLW
jgi:hypothetical protein